jgi:hypothetical protein
LQMVFLKFLIKIRRSKIIFFLIFFFGMLITGSFQIIVGKKKLTLEQKANSGTKNPLGVP